MLEVLGFVSNGVYPVLSLENSGSQSCIVTKSPSNLGKGLNNSDRSPLLSYSKASKKYNNSTFKLPIKHLKSLISTIYVNHFRPDNVLTTINSHFKPKTVSGFNLKFET
jgi:hypothetical protein